MAATELIIVAEAGEEAGTPLGVGHQLNADNQQQAIDSPTDSSILLRLHRKPFLQHICNVSIHCHVWILESILF